MTDRRWIVLRLEAPLLAFGGVRIDHIGPTRDFPSASMLTGLLGNALGYSRTEWERHQSLQDRLVIASRIDRERKSGLLTDTQNAGLEKTDKGWTTWGEPEGRDGASYGAPHRRLRDFHMDASVTAVLSLKPPEGDPDLDTLARALDFPARPLFVGRKPCLPAGRLFYGFVVAGSAYEALRKADRVQAAPLRAMWPLGEGPQQGSVVDRIVDLPDIRNWRSGLHSGSRQVVEGRIEPEGHTG